MFFVCHPKILHRHCLQFLLGVKMASRETKNNAYAKFWGDKQRTLWYVMVFSGVVNASVCCYLYKLIKVIVFKTSARLTNLNKNAIICPYLPS